MADGRAEVVRPNLAHASGSTRTRNQVSEQPLCAGRSWGLAEFAGDRAIHPRRAACGNAERSKPWRCHLSCRWAAPDQIGGAAPCSSGRLRKAP